MSSPDCPPFCLSVTKHLLLFFHVHVLLAAAAMCHSKRWMMRISGGSYTSKNKFILNGCVTAGSKYDTTMSHFTSWEHMESNSCLKYFSSSTVSTLSCQGRSLSWEHWVGGRNTFWMEHHRNTHTHSHSDLQAFLCPQSTSSARFLEVEGNQRTCENTTNSNSSSGTNPGRDFAKCSQVYFCTDAMRLV